MTDWIQRERVRNRDEAFTRALDFAPSVEELLIRWQSSPPETFDYNEAVAAIVAQLNKEGVTAWNGDATWCVAHMLKAQFDRWQRALGAAPDGRAPSELAKALEIAATAHDGQADKQGHPYLHHVLQVVLRSEPGDEQVVAALHDVVEDTEVTLDSLKTSGFSEAVLEAVNAITRRDGETYTDYITRAAANPIARAVKVQDVQDNIARRTDEVDPSGTLYRRYRKALDVLGGDRRTP